MKEEKQWESLLGIGVGYLMVKNVYIRPFSICSNSLLDLPFFIY